MVSHSLILTMLPQLKNRQRSLNELAIIMNGKTVTFIVVRIFLSQEATVAFEKARTSVSQFINSSNSSEIIFTKGTTESINLVANSYGNKFLKKR